MYKKIPHLATCDFEMLATIEFNKNTILQNTFFYLFPHLLS